MRNGLVKQGSAEVMRDAWAGFRAELRKFNGAPNREHLLVIFPPTVAIREA